MTIVYFNCLPIRWHLLVAISLVALCTLPLRTSSLAELKELEYLRSLDDSISYRVVFRPLDELPEQYASQLMMPTTTSQTTTSAQTTTAAPDDMPTETEKVEDDTESSPTGTNVDETDQSQEKPSLTPTPPSSSSSSSYGASAPPEQHKLVKIVSADAEEYQCVLPVLAPSSKRRIESYHGPSPAELVQSIYADQVCSFRIEPYWNYELCHGRYVLQYHENKEAPQKRTEYYLGNFAAKDAEAEAKKFDQLNPPMRKIGDDRLAYYPVTYTQGTVCDLTGKPRQTTVLYVCDEDARQNIQSINEVSSCHYELVVLSREICAHPSFQRLPTNEYEIRCYASAPAPSDDGEGTEDKLAAAAYPKPKALKQLEEEQRLEFLGEYGLFRSSSPYQLAKNVMAKLLKAHLMEDDSLEATLNQWDALFEAMKKSNLAPQNQQQQQQGAGPTADEPAAADPRGGAGADGPSTAPPHSPPKHGTDGGPSSSLVDRFWRGDVCLQGGTGWWKHEVCLGRTVSQYHEEVHQDGTKQRRQSIMLGKFDEAVHKAWAAEHPGKAVERKDGTVVQVAHMYTQGDICTETGAHRDCQVRMKCRQDIDAKKVFIYMLEPSTCSYVVVLESAMFCAKLQHVDEFGLLLATEAVAAGDGGANEEATTAQQQQQSLRQQDTLKKRTFGDTTVVFDLANQEEIMRVVRNLLEGAGDGQVLVSAAKLKFGKSVGASVEVDDEGPTGNAEETAEHGDDDAARTERGGGAEASASDNETSRQSGGAEAESKKDAPVTVHGAPAETTTTGQQRQQEEGREETAHHHEQQQQHTVGQQKEAEEQKERVQQQQQQVVDHVDGAARGGEL